MMEEWAVSSTSKLMTEDLISLEIGVMITFAMIGDLISSMIDAMISFLTDVMIIMTGAMIETTSITTVTTITGTVTMRRLLAPVQGPTRRRTVIRLPGGT